MPNGTPMAWMASDNDQPLYIDHGLGPGFTDVDGFTYLDFNASDMAMFCGHVIVLFQGHYHGHFEEGLVDLEGG
jgi:glutamate-1-semialdehyde aminotransferase